MDKFAAELAKLNTAQREAVETIEGPLLIVAGPGTGKTQTLALRLARILQQTQVRPHNLLALTFTESGAIALKQRLASVIGSDAFGIVATTFHSFCAGLAAQFPAEFAGTRERTNLDALGQYKLLREILGSEHFPLLHPLRAPELYLPELANRIQVLKREGISPRHFREIVAEEEAQLEQGAARLNKKTGKPLGRVLTAEKVIAKQLELARIYELYQKLLAARSLADYDDLILSVVEKLESQDEFLLAYLQENFLYATVDEFQDTNGGQMQLLKAWASYDPKPNLCVVGDDDQSIYRFAGASLANILDFTHSFPTAKIVTLTENYRSNQEILDTATSLIAHNTERLVNKIPRLSKELVSQTSQKGTGDRGQGTGSLNTSDKSLNLQTQDIKVGLPEILEFETAEDEAAWVTSEIHQLLESGVLAEEIAVLYRTRRSGDLLASYLARAGVDVSRTDGRDAAADPRVRQLIDLLCAVARPDDSAALITVLFADYTELPVADVYRLARAATRDASVLDFLASQTEFEQFTLELTARFQALDAVRSQMRDARCELAVDNLKSTQLNNKEQESGDNSPQLPRTKLVVEFTAPEAIQAFAAKFLSFQRAKAEQSLSELVETVLADSGLAARVAARAEYESAENLAVFLNFVRGFAEANSSAGLTELLSDLELMQSHRLPLSAPTRPRSAVTLATAHGSKGLEWGQVFLIGCIDDRWGGRTQPDKLKLPGIVGRGQETKPHEQLVDLQFEQSAASNNCELRTANCELEEERRLFFVALTRARDRLTLTAAASYDSRPAAPSRFLAEIAPELVQRRSLAVPPATKLRYILPAPATRPLDSASSSFLRSLVEHYRLSATGLNTYLACPRKFLYQALLRLPIGADQTTREILTFGSVTHRALEEYCREYRRTGVLPAKELALDTLKAALAREPLPAARRERIALDASTDLAAYLDWHVASLQPPLFVEYDFTRHDVHLDSIPLSGKADRIDLLDVGKATARIIDYKTKKPQTAAAIRGESCDTDGADYRQLVFYKLLAELDPRFIYQIETVTLSFTRSKENGELVDVSFQPTTAEVEQLKQVIIDTWARIQVLDFACVCDQAVCDQCDWQGICRRVE